MAALAPVAAETNAYRSQSHENIMIAALKPQDLERVNRAEVAKPGPWLVPTQDRPTFSNWPGRNAGLRHTSVQACSVKLMACCDDGFLAKVLIMSSSFSQKNRAHIVCCLCCAQVSSGTGRLVI